MCPKTSYYHGTCLKNSNNIRHVQTNICKCKCPTITWFSSLHCNISVLSYSIYIKVEPAEIVATFLRSRTASLLHCDLGYHPDSISLCSSGPEPEPNTLSEYTLADMLWLLLAGALISIIITDVRAKFTLTGLFQNTSWTYMNVQSLLKGKQKKGAERDR